MDNGITIYTQNFAPEESFITSCCINDVVKKADIYSKVRHKDIWNQTEGTRCGATLNFDWDKDLDKVKDYATAKIPLKIDIRRFLPLSNIKYLPAIAGKIELRLYFGTAGMVWCPIGIPKDLKVHPKDWSEFTIPKVTCEFVPIRKKATIWTNCTGYDETPSQEKYGTTLEAKEITGKADGDYQITSCYSVIPCFGLDTNVYNALKMRYAQQVLTFPTQTLMVQTMSKQLNTQNTATTATVTPRFIDSIFFLFPLENNYRTVFKNPNFEAFQLRCGGYGSVPNVAFSTSNEGDEISYPCFIEYCQNAMNVNGIATGFNKEVTQSLTALNENSIKPRLGLTSKDTTNFFIGLPTETDNTFQQGQTSQTPINYEIQCKLPQGENTYTKLNNIPPRICFLIDSTFNIQVQPDGMPPIVDLSAYDITSPVSSA